MGTERLSMRKTREIRRQAEGRAAVPAMAERFAIEVVLTRLGYLRREPGGWC